MSHEIDTTQDDDWDVVASTDPTVVSTKDYNKELDVVTIHHQSSFGKLVEFDSTLFIDTRQIKDASLKNVLFQAVQAHLGAGPAMELRNGMFSVDFLAKHMDGLLEAMKAQGSPDVAKDKRFAPFWAAVVKQREAVIAAYQERLAQGNVEYNDLDFFFAKNDHVVDVSGEYPMGGVVVGTNYIRSMMGNYLQVKINVVQAYGARPKVSTISVEVDQYHGLKPVGDLSVVKITDALRQELTERGNLFRSVVTGASYMRYTGQITRAGWWGKRSAFRADGRVMVDPLSFSRIDDDGFDKENRPFNQNSNFFNKAEEKASTFTITDDNLWRCFPYVLGFSLRAKVWGRMAVANLEPIQWRDDAFDFLVMDEGDKTMVRALVDHSAGSFSDIVDEKGGGTIFMLAGSPGLGKTLLAETVAEISHKPLYSVSVGELGTEPTELENRLRMILDVATIWDAVLLIDEADIFLEARDTHDIVRNAMVGVFLRLLEYHQGVLFLTTNRVKEIDQAFYSRISVPLMFDEADDAKRAKIWGNLITAAKLDKVIDVGAIRELAKRDVNGRQVKNAIRIGMTLAKAEGRPVTLADLMRPLDKAEAFQAKIK